MSIKLLTVRAVLGEMMGEPHAPPPKREGYLRFKKDKRIEVHELGDIQVAMRAGAQLLDWWASGIGAWILVRQYSFIKQSTARWSPAWKKQRFLRHA